MSIANRSCEFIDSQLIDAAAVINPVGYVAYP